MAESKKQQDGQGAAQTRAAILDAAETIFAQNGFSGARVDAIAAAAGCNKSLLYQYFGNKLALYATVLQRADEEARALHARVYAPFADETIAADGRKLRSALETAFTAVFDHLLSRPRLLRILMWEMAEGWQTYAQIHPQPQALALDRLETIFWRASQAGLLRSTFAPAVQLTMALQICQTYLASLPLYSQLAPGADLTSDAGLDQGRRYVAGLIAAGILTDAYETDER